MEKRLLILPGYLIGIGSLCLITYRTILAFFNEQKSITIHINRYGEQYVDIAVLIFIWSICLVGFKYLYSYISEDKSFGFEYPTITQEKKVRNIPPFIAIQDISTATYETDVTTQGSDATGNCVIYQFDNNGNPIVSYTVDKPFY